MNILIKLNFFIFSKTTLLNIIGNIIDNIVGITRLLLLTQIGINRALVRFITRKLLNRLTLPLRQFCRWFDLKVNCLINCFLFEKII